MRRATERVGKFSATNAAHRPRRKGCVPAKSTPEEPKNGVLWHEGRRWGRQRGQEHPVHWVPPGDDV